jgi:4-amino-4-deoxy-L-arabinose transferase-like glycosyltransferase
MLTLALLTRSLTLLFVVQRFPHMWLYSRGIELGTLAQSLVAGHGLSSPFGGSTGPTALLSPGYPVLIALCFRIFGSFTFHAAIAVMVLQLLFSLATVLLVIQVAEQCFGSRAANLAGTFWAVSLPLVWMPTIFWETCLSTLLLLGMVALSLRAIARPRTISWPVIGAYCGLAALVNPALLLTLLALLIWMAWQTRKTCRGAPLLGLLVLALVYAPWPIRNARVLGAFIPMRSTVAFELWMGNRAGATGFLDESLFPIFNRGEYDQYAALGEVAYMHHKSALAGEHIDAHLGEFLRLSTVRFLRYWTGTGSQHGSVVFSIHAVLTTLGGLIGLGRLWQRRSFRLAGLFLLPLILFPLPYYITHAEFRYRLVVDPLLTILAAHGVCASRAS